MRRLTRRLGAFFLDVLQTVVLALSIFVISYLFLFQPHQVKGNSMSPNFENDWFLLTDKVSYRLGQPQRGDVAIFKAPPSEPCAERECEYIKRIIGLPGEEVKIAENGVFVNSLKLNEVFLPEGALTRGGTYLRLGETTRLKEDEYLLLGDNRSYSRDSREFGPIKKEDLVGKAWLIYWPFGEIGIITRGQFN